ncbi:alpha/beta family hydrolase [Synechococcus sp. CBW1004]|uniref:alpha/beta family hydrolase n=1 Tax=Synechococcus sp. CBW1004 TaxID=1353136 RepID=UPI00351B40A5
MGGPVSEAGPRRIDSPVEVAASGAEASPRLIDGPADAPATLLLAHGAGAPMDSPFMAAIATGLAERGWRVVRFEFPYMARARLTGRRAGPDRLPKLLEAFRQQVALEGNARPLILGGKSMGGRVASLLLDELASADTAASDHLTGHPIGMDPITDSPIAGSLIAGSGIAGSRIADSRIAGGLCLGYPFHPPGRPEQLRTEHLQTLRTETLILQGERDPFGRREEVEGYALSPRVHIQWLPHGDHSFTPTRRSGLSEADNWNAAVAHADRFCRERLSPCSDKA